jgi:hypothetical protein
MESITNYELSGEYRSLIVDLCRSDQETGGRPRLPVEQRERAWEHLTAVLVDTRVQIAQLALLEQFHQAKFHPPVPRQVCPGEDLPPPLAPAGFRHNQLLPEDKSSAVVERGPNALTDEELAALLLNPLALWDLADRIHSLLPEYWLPHLDRVGQELMAEYGLEIAIPGESSRE